MYTQNCVDLQYLLKVELCRMHKCFLRKGILKNITFIKNIISIRKLLNYISYYWYLFIVAINFSEKKLDYNEIKQNSTISSSARNSLKTQNALTHPESNPFRSSRKTLKRAAEISVARIMAHNERISRRAVTINNIDDFIVSQVSPWFVSRISLH